MTALASKEVCEVCGLFPVTGMTCWDHWSPETQGCGLGGCTFDEPGETRGHFEVHAAVREARRRTTLPVEAVAVCPACGEPIDYCPGHGDGTLGRSILDWHDRDDHENCDPRGCELSTFNV